MSQAMSRNSGHCPGRWAPSAGELVEDIRLGITALPNPIQVRGQYWRDIKRFFEEVLRAYTEPKLGPWNYSYLLARRALGSCPETPLLLVEGQEVSIAIIEKAEEEADIKLVELMDFFFDNQSLDPAEWGEFADFLERVKFLDETDQFVRPGRRLIAGSLPRTH